MGIRGDWRYFSGEGPDTTNASPVNDTGHFTVPNDTIWHILSIWMEYTATATAGTRSPRIRIVDDTGDVVLEIAAGTTLTASQARQYAFFPGAPDLTSARDTDLITTPLPSGLIMLPGWEIQVLGGAGADTTDDSDATSDLDDAIVQIMGGAQHMFLQTSFGQFQSSDQ